MNGLYLTIARWVVFASVASGVYMSGDSKYGLFVIYLLVAVVLGLRIFDRYKKISKPTKGFPFRSPEQLSHFVVDALSSLMIFP